MNVALLRLAIKHRGVRAWIVPGYGNGAKLIPARLTGAGWGAAFYWPHRDDNGEVLRGVDLDRHRAMARHYAKALIRETGA